MPRDPWDEPAHDPWDDPESPSATVERLAPGESQDQGPPVPPNIHPSRLQTVGDLSAPESALVGAVPTSLGAAYDTAGTLLGDIPRHLSGNSSFARVHDLGDLLSRYGEAKKSRETWKGRAESQHPLATLGGQMAGGMAVASPALASLPASAGLMTQGATASTVSRLAEKADLESLPGDVLTDLGFAGAVKSGADLLRSGLVASAGRILQKPQQMLESTANKIGDWRITKWMAGDKPRAMGENVSPRVAELRQQRMAGEYGNEAAQQMSEALRQVGGLAGQRISSLTPSDKQIVAEQMAGLFSKRGSVVSPEDLVRNWDELAPRMFLNAEKDSVGDLLRSVNTRDEAYLAALGSNIAARARVVGKAGSQVPPVRSMLDAAESSHNEYLTGKMSRGGQPVQPGQPQGEFHIDPNNSPAPKTPDEEFALRMAQASQRGEAGIDQIRSPDGVVDDYRWPKSETGNVAAMSEEAATDALDKYRPWETSQGLPVRDRLDLAKEATQSPLGQRLGPLTENQASKMDQAKENFAAIGQRHAENLNAATENIMSKARQFREMMEQARASADDFANTRQRGQVAGQELDRIATGRQAIGNLAGVGTAMTSGNGIAGLAGATLAAATGKPLGRGLLKGIDLSSALGQKLERVTPLVERFAGMDNAMGRAVRWALSADGQTMLVRLAAIADLPSDD